MAVDTTSVEVTLPAMGESVTEGTVLGWLKAEGDHVAADEPVVEISTDKVDAEVPAPVAGTILKIRAQEGDTVAVGAVLCEIAPGDGGGDGAAPEAPPAAEEKIIDVAIPAMGESVTEGVILEWLKQPGDALAEDEGIVEVSTDKVDAELPAPVAGSLVEALAEVGDTVTVGQVVARMKVGAVAGAQPKAKQPEGAPQQSNGGHATAAAPAGVKATPVARRVAATEGVDLTSVHGTGPNGRITKHDVLNGGANGAAAAAVQNATVLRGGAATLARYMDESRQIPTATSFRTITVTTLDGRRKQLKDAGRRVSFT
ncbi:MAG: hypothetical protein QOE86_1787, partial [Solirubrobacteraceae bacterium]|nr:hypothetical protein [Solirubrobacteraceae bacterium]